jgi:hypothetical protein
MMYHVRSRYVAYIFLNCGMGIQLCSDETSSAARTARLMDVEVNFPASTQAPFHIMPAKVVTGQRTRLVLPHRPPTEDFFLIR